MAEEPERRKGHEHDKKQETSGSNENGHQHGGMGMRGVTRAMEEMKHHGHGGHDHKMSREDRHHMLVMHHKQTLWIYWTLVILGFWVLFSPLTFSYAKATVDPSGGRELWLTPAQRASFMRLGYHDESIHFLGWIEGLCFCSKDHLQPVYRIDGSGDLGEEELSHLHGYRGSRPVRIGNAAAKQFQLDVPGHLLETVFLCYVRMPREVDAELWEALKDLADLAARNWREPDCGIWEDRSQPRHYLHSKLYCWVAVDRALRLAEKFELLDENELWRKAREEMRQLILDQGYDADVEAFRQALDADGSDATSLVLPRVGLLPASDERVQSTVRNIRSTLGEEGLIYRRRRAEARPDEGILLLCNFWLVDVLIDSGQREEAEELFQRILQLGNDVGLFPEEVGPSTGEWLGNFPQGFTHLALIRSAINLQETSEESAKKEARINTGGQ